MQAAIEPKKTLGQHFLRDRNIALKIIGIFDPAPTDHVLEIGPGTGALTSHLAGACGRLILVEKDSRLAGLLRRTYGTAMQVSVIEADFLKSDLPFIADGGRLRIIGSLPYYITTPILLYILDRMDSVRDMLFVVQLEAARRIIAAPGDDDYGVLSVLMQTWTRCEILFRIPPSVFFPEPSVQSAAVRAVLRRDGGEIVDKLLYRKIVKETFGKRRKMLRASLRSVFPDVRIPDSVAGIDLRRRPESLSVAEFITLSNGLNEVIHYTGT